MSQALTLRDAYAHLRDKLEAERPSLAAIIPAATGLTADRAVAVLLDAASRTPDLLKCEPKSLLRTLRQATTCGLELNSPFGEAYAVPYWNGRKQQQEAQFVSGYRGLIKLVRTGPRVDTLHAELVREADSFDYELGSHRRIIHKPATGQDKDRGEVRFAYAQVRFRGGGEEFVVMDRAALDKIRAGSKAKSGPWFDHTDEMYRKCPVRRLCKYQDLSPLARVAVEYEDRGAMARGELGAVRESLESGRGDALKAKLAARGEDVLDAEFEEGGDGG